ncbi:hypothetical protein BGY98DRAFT_355080 [Russula aff. rugulosa BPL654]|nr:hypothetical protein BGY98DRAFT_355080 [Russula aff. rugulosa BPL654]
MVGSNCEGSLYLIGDPRRRCQPGILSRESIFAGIGVLLSAAKDVRAGQDALFEVFERIEAFFERLGIYTKAAYNQEMVDIITKIMVEVLNVLGIATKEIRQGRMKKYLKRLIGRTDIEDALKRLDRLTQEEARMAAAQVLKVTNTVDDRVQGIADNMLSVDNRVAGVDGRVAGIDERVAGVGECVASVGDLVACVDDRVKDVDNMVKAVDDKVAAVNDDVKKAAVVMQQTADELTDDIDQVKRS